MSDVLADVDVGALAQLQELRARQAGLAALRTVVEDPESPARRRLPARRGAQARQHQGGRVSATVVIGHPLYVTGDVTPQEIAETLRTYDTHQTRIEVITYETLLDSAARMLALSSARQDTDLDEEPVV
jgi:hypothetical protein